MFSVAYRNARQLSESEGFVLVGGRSSRMGQSKAFLPFGEGTMLERSTGLFQALGLPVRLVADAEQIEERFGLPLLVDRIPGTGPLGAIYTALSATESEHCFFLPSDMPLVRPELFRIMMTLVESWDAIVPEDSKGHLYPISAYYSKRCQESTLRLIESGERRVGKLLTEVNLRLLRLPIKDFGIADDCLLNINTPGQYKKLLGTKL